MQIAPHFLRIGRLPFITKDRVSRYYGNVWEFREAVNQALGDAVAEVFGLGIITHVDERQDRNRFDSWGSGRAKEKLPQSANIQSEQQQQQCHYAAPN